MERVLLFFVLSVAALVAHADDVPILRFHQVSPVIARGARPDEQGIAALAQMKIKTIIDLENDEDVVADEIKLANAYGINVISKPMSGFWSPDEKEVNEIEQAITDPGNQPVFVHCEHGQDRTGLIIGLYRVFFEKWKPADAYTEMVDFGFHPLLFLLKNYYEKATGFEDGWT